MPGRGAAAGTGTPGKRGLLAPPHSSALSLSLRLPAAPSLQAGILYLLGPEVALGPPEKGPTHGPLGRGVGAGTGGAVFIKSERT